MQYCAYYHTTGQSGDLPVQVEADNYHDAVSKFASWRNRLNNRGTGDITVSTQPFRIDRDDPAEIWT